MDKSFNHLFLSHKQECLETISVSGLFLGVAPRLSDPQNSVSGQTPACRNGPTAWKPEQDREQGTHREAWAEPARKCLGTLKGLTRSPSSCFQRRNRHPGRNDPASVPRRIPLMFSRPALCAAGAQAAAPGSALMLKMRGEGLRMGCFQHFKINGSKAK